MYLQVCNFNLTHPSSNTGCNLHIMRGCDARFLRVGLDPQVELLITFFEMFHCSLNELSEFFFLFAPFNVG
jgi:hypothetical protein